MFGDVCTLWRGRRGPPGPTPGGTFLGDAYSSSPCKNDSVCFVLRKGPLAAGGGCADFVRPRRVSRGACPPATMVAAHTWKHTHTRCWGKTLPAPPFGGAPWFGGGPKPTIEAEPRGRTWSATYESLGPIRLCGSFVWRPPAASDPHPGFLPRAGLLLPRLVGFAPSVPRRSPPPPTNSVLPFLEVLRVDRGWAVEKRRTRPPMAARSRG